ncbi:MAG: hypothetical protein JSS82_03865 [Bacteroidetes bacterium]|nr:hypothetical protein [Bacteroidota bacterium]
MNKFKPLIVLGVLLCACNNKKTDKEILRSLKDKCDVNVKCYTDQAIKDFENDKMQLFLIGLIDANSFEDYYSVYLEKTKNINIIYAGDVADTFLLAYNLAMEKKVREKFGADFFKECEEKVRDSMSKIKKAAYQ